MFDNMHLEKSHRNNWYNNPDQEFLYPPWSSGDDDHDKTLHTASFQDVRTLYKEEAGICLVTGFKITHKAVYLNNFDKQKVSLVEQVFAPSTIAALSAKVGCEETVDFMKISRKWMNIINIKNVQVGERTCQPDKLPFTLEGYETDSRFEFLAHMKKWMIKWYNNPDAAQHRHSKDTHNAFINTLTVMPLLIKDLFVNYKPEYILTSKFLTDQIERRFGKFRTIAGNEYRVSQMVVERCEKKMRDRHMIKWTQEDAARLAQGIDEIEVEHFSNDQEDEIEQFKAVLILPVSSHSHLIVDDAINYVAGASADKVKRYAYNNQCGECISSLLMVHNGFNLSERAAARRFACSE